MEITPQTPGGTQVIQSYGPAGFRIAGSDYPDSVLVTEQATIAWSVTDFAQVTMESLEPLLSQQPPLEVILFGTGARMELLPPTLRQQLRARGIGADAMDTGAACRTFNVLISEARRVGAALILPQAG